MTLQAPITAAEEPKLDLVATAQSLHRKTLNEFGGIHDAVLAAITKLRESQVDTSKIPPVLSELRLLGKAIEQLASGQFKITDRFGTTGREFTDIIRVAELTCGSLRVQLEGASAAASSSPTELGEALARLNFVTNEIKDTQLQEAGRQAYVDAVRQKH